MFPEKRASKYIFIFECNTTTFHISFFLVIGHWPAVPYKSLYTSKWQQLYKYEWSTSMLSVYIHNVFSSYTRSMSTLVHFGPFHMKMMSAVCECGWFPGRASFYSNSTSIFAFLPAANTSLTMIPPLISVTESKSWLEDPYFTFSTTPEVMKVSRSQVSIRKTL